MIAAHIPLADSRQTMKRTLRSRGWAPSVAAVAAFGALGATCAYWALQLLAPPVAIAPAGSLVDTRNAHDLAAAQALFGSAVSGSSASISAPVDVRVLGVAASPLRGSAVLVVDSAAARAFLVGDEVGADMRLVEVRSDTAVLERRGVRIELPAPRRPSVALLSSGPQSAETAEAPVRHDPAVDAATLAPSAPPPADPPRVSGIRGSGVRNLAAPGNADASAD